MIFLRGKGIRTTGLVPAGIRGTWNQSVISRLWQRFQIISNVSRCYSLVAPSYSMIGTGIWRVTVKGNMGTASDLSPSAPSATATTVSRQTTRADLRAQWSICS
ncbi:hypothetical protein AVEN_219422-1 [Araneus ventricosus]|uniref:Uncharacterized protein n=1 Tax=Araneus ventricosus TaxID=182803 RepID=A0A4Y2K812_ARAVE|nr:hypothetical protein AVEN_219422-1 [Araneus ventricosus]